MTDQDQETIRLLLKQALPPVDPNPRRDLWPSVVRKLDQHPVLIPWYDWAIAALLAALLAWFPQIIPVLMYHL